uniref:Membrane fusogenic activity n=1 Tax=Ganoderma boninense TaxID=34458 RepID=A0A5K1JTD6_9APHY|nr:Membrane fusogenic activity [Ganoderma boninense]
MPSSSSSSSVSVSDALTNLSKAATVALNAVQGAHDQVYVEAERARAERDDALRALHDAQLDAKDLEGREERWKAALDKSDLTIKHQSETITQLRSEVQTWKTQLTRLEESSRQEIDGWKEQYLRAEHERARLSARIEELIAGQLAWNAAAHAYTAPYTPRIGYAEIPEPSASSSGLTTKRASTSHARRAPGTPRANGHAPTLDDDDDVPLTSVRKPKTNTNRNVSQPERRSRAAASPSRAPTARRRENAAAADVPQASGSRATPRTPAGAQPSAAPRTQLIRRVTAVVDVKEEDDDDAEGLDDLDSAASGSMYDPDERPPAAAGSRRRRGSTASGRSKRSRREFDEEDDDDDHSVDEVGEAHGDDGGECGG